MSRIKSTNTGPEKAIKKLLNTLHFKYRLHPRGLPGKPDIVLKNRGTAIFANGCFWHQHRGCKRATAPKSNKRYWLPKLRRNVDKQTSDKKLLKKLGWYTAVIWECEIKKFAADPNKFKEKL